MSEVNYAVILKKKIAEKNMILETITLYNEGKFPEMQNLIREYGEHEFFTDLYALFEVETWRRPANKYFTFVGITIQFFKIYS